MPDNAFIEDRVEPADFTGLTKVVLKYIEELFGDAIFAFSG